MISDYNEARKELKNIRGMAARKVYNYYVRNLIFDLTPTIDFILDQIEEIELRQALTEALP